VHSGRRPKAAKERTRGLRCAGSAAHTAMEFCAAHTAMEFCAAHTAMEFCAAHTAMEFWLTRKV
jgi:hypothetical protein